MEVRLKSLDNVRRQIASMNKRTDYWLAGEFNVIWEDWLNGDVGFVFDFVIASGESDCGLCSTDSTVDESSCAYLHEVNASHRYDWRNDPVFVDVVHSDKTIKEVATRLRTVGRIVGLDFIENDRFQIRVVNADSFVEGIRPGFSLFGRVEAACNSVPFFVKRECDVVVGLLGGTSQCGNKIVERTSKAPDAITDRQHKISGHSESGQKHLRTLGRIEMQPYVITVYLDIGVPDRVSLVNVSTCSIDFEI